MSVESEADRAAMLADFGVTVTYGSGSSFVGIFDSGYQLVDIGDHVGVSSSQLRLKARTSDVSAIAKGTTLTINSVGYKLEEQQPDGTGMSDLLLSKA